ATPTRDSDTLAHTTLFRSWACGCRATPRKKEGAVSGALCGVSGGLGGYESALQALAPPVAEVPLTLVTVATAAAGVLWVILVESDRKSTRLNSSHSQSSYA